MSIINRVKSHLFCHSLPFSHFMAILKANALEFMSNSAEQTERLGVRLGQLLQPFDILALQGDLGAGKTTLARGIGRGWGTTLRVTSPTFTLVNEYPRPSDGRLLYHLDCYRLNNDDEVESMGLDDILNGRGALMIEWSERILSWLPADYLQVDLNYVNTTRRRLLLTAHGPRSQAILDTFKQNAFGI